MVDALMNFVLKGNIGPGKQHRALPNNKRFLRMLNAVGQRSPLNDSLAVFENALEPLVLTAQLWARAKSSITIENFLSDNSSYVLLLGLDESTTEATESCKSHISLAIN